MPWARGLRVDRNRPPRLIVRAQNGICVLLPQTLNGRRRPRDKRQTVA